MNGGSRPHPSEPCIHRAKNLYHRDIDFCIESRATKTKPARVRRVLVVTAAPAEYTPSGDKGAMMAPTFASFNRYDGKKIVVLMRNSLSDESATSGA